jgi:hypothetical protein
MRFALILLTALFLPSPKPAPIPKPPITTGDTNKPQADHGGTQDNPLVVHIKGTEQSQQEAAYNIDKDDYENKRKNYELLLTGMIAAAALAQVATATVQICIYRKQSGIMKKTLGAVRIQANTMAAQTTILGESVAVAKRSAETTAESFRAMIDKERARLSLEIGEFNFGEIPVVNYKITCHGTTPAYIVSSWEMTTLNPFPDFGWPEDAFGVELQQFPSVLPVGIFEGYNFIMGTDRKAISMSTLDKKISDGKLYLHFRVRVLYKDVFDSVRVHELQISKIYGVKPAKPTQSLFERLAGREINPVYGGTFGKYPSWEDSAYKFGEYE